MGSAHVYLFTGHSPIGCGKKQAVLSFLRLFAPLAVLVLASAGLAQGDPAEICQNAAQAALEKYKDKGLKPDQFAISLALINRKDGSVITGDVLGDQGFYPASVVKLFYVVYAAQELQDGKLVMTPEFDRAAKDMIVDSINDATALVLDTITGTTGGPMLPGTEFKVWQDKRNAVNRFYQARGFKGINVNQKTWNEGPYGRERQSLGKNYQYRNSLTANACVKLMTSIAMGKAVIGAPRNGKDWAEWVKGYLHRTIPADDRDAGYQSKAFTGKILPKGSQLWSKAGYTDTARHDVAWVKLPDGKEFVIAIFTKNCSDNEDLIPFISSTVIGQLGS